MKRVVVIGGGISGLATALHLKDGASLVPGGLHLTVLEASDDPGGNIRTRRKDGFVIERGPNGYLDNAPATFTLVRRLGLEGELQRADHSAARRFLYRNGKLHRLPEGPLSFLFSPVLSIPGRLRVLGEPFARPRPQGADETVFEFARRRIGKEAASVLVDAMVSGVFAGDARALSLASSFPKMAAMEEEHGSLVRAMLARMRERRAAKREVAARRARGEEVEELTQPGGPAGPGGTLTSFREGMDVLPKALARELRDAVRCGVKVMTVERGPGSRGQLMAAGLGSLDHQAPWLVRLAGGEALAADVVLLAVPAPKAVPVLGGLDEELVASVQDIRTAPLTVVALAYAAAAMGGAPHGFGFLVPRGEGPRILGCLWDSSIFPGRAPKGKVLLRAMMGGAHDLEANALSNEEMEAIVRRDLKTVMGLSAEPLFVREYRWRLGIGQYTVGHQERLDRIHGALARNPGLWVAGSSFYGISMNACMEKAEEQAEEILSYLSG
jgi:protoporphyrinogen/coproporphyrinogen III oxidase